MYRFNSDYVEGCHPSILKALNDCNFEQNAGYGTDDHSARAADMVRQLIGRKDAFVFFMVGGTPSNVTVISAALRPHQGVFSAETGHINCHESGAVEHSGHKVLSIPGKDGKITAEDIEREWHVHFDDGFREHIVQPKMVYISNTTEVGTIYTRAELKAISDFCHSHNLYLFLDGARLGYALACEENDLTLKDIADFCDVFYIGGTKQGALIGEALVITNPAIAEDFRYIVKVNSGRLAKGWLIGIQFECLLKDNLYLELAANADRQALRIKKALIEHGYVPYVDSPTNQQFFVMPNRDIAEMKKKGFICSEEKPFTKDSFVVRWCTSWATEDAAVDKLIEAISTLKG